MTFPAESVAWRGWGYGVAGLALVSRGWFAPETAPPTPTPTPAPVAAPSPKPRSVVRRRSGGGGGGGGSIRPWRLELPKLYVHFEEPEPEEEADFALMHVGEPGAVVKALADGSVETFIDEKGRTSIVLSGDDGTRYWYADVGKSTVTSGTWVRAGQPIARTKPGATPVPPSIVLSGSVRAALPSPGRVEEPPPAQIVFIETPLPPAPKKRRIKLVPIPALAAPPSEWGAVTRPTAAPQHPIIKVAVFAGALAALLFALSAIKPPPRRKRKR